jgi:Flp pilus assembly protein TadD
MKGDFVRALADAERCAEVSPKFGGCYKARGLARDRLGEAAGSVLADLSKAVELEPDNAESHAVRAAHLLAHGDYAGASRDEDAILKANPDDVSARVGRGAALMQQGNFVGALADFDRALRLAPTAVGIHVNMGFARFGDGDFAGAGADFKIAAEASPDYPSYIALWLYIAQARAGKTDTSPPAPGAANDWPAPVIAFLAGKTTRAQLDAQAHGADQLCEAAFYAGEQALIASRNDDAAREMKQALATCHGTLLERAAALGEGRRLNVSAADRK